MDARTCIQKLRLIASVAAATVDASGSPQVRTIGVMHAEGEELYFLTARGKPFYRELIATKKVQLLGLSRFKEMIRFDGAPELLPPEEQDLWREKIFAENPCMANVYPGASRSILDIFRLRRGVIEYFDLGVHPIFRETYELGGATAKPKGYETGDSCSGCGICAASCPQGCIEAGAPYRIQKEHCLHCGLCREKCPAGAILRLGD